MTRRTSRAAEHRVRFAPAAVIVLVLFVIVFDFIFAIVHQRWLFAPVARERDVQFTRFDAAFPVIEPPDKATRLSPSTARMPRGSRATTFSSSSVLPPRRIADESRLVVRMSRSLLRSSTLREEVVLVLGQRGRRKSYSRQKAKKRDNFLCFFRRCLSAGNEKCLCLCVFVCVCVCVRVYKARAGAEE